MTIQPVLMCCVCCSFSRLDVLSAIPLKVRLLGLTVDKIDDVFVEIADGGNKVGPK